MDQNLPDPFTAADADLRCFKYMPLDVLRLRDSDMAAVEDAEAFRCAVMLWCAAWHQVPAGSLPAEESRLARLAGYGRDLRKFRRARDAGGMSGWILCSDGRHYHHTVAEKVNEALRVKRKQQERTAAATAARVAKDASGGASRFVQATEIAMNTVHVTKGARGNVTKNVTKETSLTVTSSKGEEGKGKEGKKESIDLPARLPLVPAEFEPRAAPAVSRFEDFWLAYPARIQGNKLVRAGRRDAEKAWNKATRTTPPETICSALRRYPWPEPAFIPMASSWLNGRRWEDEPSGPGAENGAEPARDWGHRGPPPCEGALWSECENQWLSPREQRDCPT